VTGSDLVASLEHVSVEYAVASGVVHALQDISYDFAPGTSTAIVGRSGSGKSTLISVLALLRQPNQGEVTVCGRKSSALADHDLSSLRGEFVGTVFQSFHLDPSASAAENVMLPWYFSGGVSRASARRRAGEVLDRMGIGELASRRTAEMSGGQRQRVAIARALYPRPRLLIADEPTGNLDEATAASIAEELFGLPADMGAAVVVVTHDAQIAAMATDVLHITMGRLNTEGEG
jgi:ABC-type lipoprotein export system ATPase subunit